jgi:hypothetical protein
LLDGEALAAWLECSEEIRGVYESAKKEIINNSARQNLFFSAEEMETR